MPCSDEFALQSVGPLLILPPVRHSPAKRPPAHLHDIVQALLGWFSHAARDLPWRRIRDPYAIWISEIMLQQTQVKTVIPFWNRWMQNLPTITHLAEADPQKVLKLWEGLGYYHRARNLQRAAKLICSDHEREFPADFDQILTLPGVGPYTAGAIASIAFNQPRPILDGNVTRVLARLFGITQTADQAAVKNQLWDLAARLVRHAEALPPASTPQKKKTAGNCSDLNQSLMELGALLCTPRQPRCPNCPLTSLCRAYRTGKTDHIPRLASRPAATHRHVIAWVITSRGKILVRQRRANVVNSHLWEFPNVEVNGQPFDPLALAKASTGLPVESLRPLCTIRHSITRYRFKTEAYLISLPATVRPTGRKWIPIADATGLPFSGAHQKILQKLTAAG